MYTYHLTASRSYRRDPGASLCPRKSLKGKGDTVYLLTLEKEHASAVKSQGFAARWPPFAGKVSSCSLQQDIPQGVQTALNTIRGRISYGVTIVLNHENEQAGANCKPQINVLGAISH